jgi:membrane fusion protein (multidrug efflux system)
MKLLRLPALAFLVLLAGCGGGNKPKTPPTPEAGYVVLTTQTVPLDIQLAGRTNAFEIADVRPQVSGLILARRFTEGATVRQGQTLYEIDPSLYKAAVAQAQASVAGAEAAHATAEVKAARYKPLAEIEAVSKQDYSDAQALSRQTANQIAQAKANLQTAEINLKFTRVPAPISGRIGRSLVTTGALVTNGQAGAMATIERLDPIFVDMQQSSADLVALRRALSSGGVAPAEATVKLTLEDGSAYPHTGKIEFSESIVEATTGAVTLRARFPNPQGLLLPGMFVRATVAQALAPNAILVPQQAVARTPTGEASVYVVSPDNHAVLRNVRADRTVGSNWLVASGLSAGDKVIVEGLERVKPNMLIRPVPAGSPQQITNGRGGGREGTGARGSGGQGR